MSQNPTPERAIDNAAQSDKDEALRNAAGMPPQGVESTTQDSPIESPATAAQGDQDDQPRNQDDQQGLNFDQTLQAERNPQPKPRDDSVAANVDGLGDLTGRELQGANDVAQAQGSTAQPDGPEAAPPSQRV